MHDLLFQSTDLDREKKLCWNKEEAENVRAGELESLWSLVLLKTLSFIIVFFFGASSLSVCEGLLDPSLCGVLRLVSWCDSSWFLSRPISWQLCPSRACTFPPPSIHPFLIYSVFLSSASPYLVLPHCWFVIIHPPPQVKRIRLAINARLDKAGTSRVREEGLANPDSFVIG